MRQLIMSCLISIYTVWEFNYFRDGFNASNISERSPSLRKIFSTDAGQLSDRLKSFAAQNKCLQDRRHLYCTITFSLPKFTWHLSDRLKVFAGQNENLLVLSGSPPLFVKTEVQVIWGPRYFSEECKYTLNLKILQTSWILYHHYFMPL